MARSPDRERGYVTAETALALPALVLVLAFALWAVQVVAGQLRCVDAAREAARALARGDSQSAARAAAQRAAPLGAVIAMTSGGGEVAVTVSADIRAPGLRGRGYHVTARAVAELEPGPGAAGTTIASTERLPSSVGTGSRGVP